MDRQIVYPGSIPLDTDLLNVQRNAMVAIGYLAQATLGKTTVADGLTCAPTQPASMAVVVGPGSVTQFDVVDTTAFGSLGALPSTPMVKTGINLDVTNFILSAPTAIGQTITYLVQASVNETDASPVILPYYNAASPGQPFSGPNNTGAPQSTQRLQSVELVLKAGPPVSAGTVVLPSVDSGWVGLYAITVLFGQSVVAADDIATLPTAPFLYHKLPQLSPGTRNLAVYQPTSQGSWTTPAGVGVVKVRMWGGGGAGGNGLGSAGGGGAGGGYSEGFYDVSAGQSILVSVGNGGSGSGSVGGTSSFGSLASATGGQAGSDGSSSVGGSGATIVGIGYGSGLTCSGASGGDSFGANGNWLSGTGGSAFAGTGGNASTGGSGSTMLGKSGSGPGAGGAGGVGKGSGGVGGPGLVLIEW